MNEIEKVQSTEIAESVWTRFFDMSSGGYEKLDYTVIWIEAPEEEAVKIFEDIFGRDPNNVTCPCCGEDYSIYEDVFEPRAGDAIVSKENIENFYGCGGCLPAPH